MTSLAAAALSFGGAEAVGGSGFLAVYLTGLVIADCPHQARSTIAVFTRARRVPRRSACS